jgi:hypothetical protein
MTLALLSSCGPAWLWVGLCGVAAGVLSMWLYKVCSPQARLSLVVDRLKQSQARLASYDGDLSGAGVLMRDTMKLSMQRLGLVLGPSLLAALPMVAMLATLDHVRLAWFETTIGSSWLWTPQGVFLLTGTISAVVTKVVMKAK